VTARRPTFICGLDLTPGPRDECPNTLHDHPLPAGYLESQEVAGERLEAGWTQDRCPDCKLYGWIEPSSERDLR